MAGGGIASLNTLTTGSQSLAVETPGVTTGTRPSWTADSGTSTHTLTIPMASANGVTAGLLSKTDYDVFSGKQDGITPSSSIVLGSVSTNHENALDLKSYGTSAGQTGELRFRELGASGVNYVGFKAPDSLESNTIWRLPSGDGASGFVLSTDGSGTLSWISPSAGSVTSIITGDGLEGGPISVTGTISLANVGTAGTYAKVTTNSKGQVTDGTNLLDTDIPNLSAAKITIGILAVERGGTGSATAQPFSVFAGPSIGPTAGAPTFRTLGPADISGLGTLATASYVSGGSGGTITDDSITNTDISSGAAIVDSKLATISSAGKVANSATTATSAGTANAVVARDGSGNFTAGIITATLNGTATNVTGTVALANGGTGATTEAGARTNLGAAASGANSDITALSGLTTPLSVAQGGTGATSAVLARSSLGAAASGANTDITSLTNLTTLSTTGNVGIGSATPGFKLDIATSGTGMQTAERLQNTVSAANNSGAQTMYSTNRTTDGLTDVAAIGGMITDISASAYKGALVFSTANNAAPTERMRIDSNGNTGIGSAAPGATLDVVGGGRFKNQNALELLPFSTSVGGTSELRFDELSTTNTNYVGFKATDVLVSNYIFTLPDSFGTNGHFLQTNGAGILSWATINSSAIADGTITTTDISDGTIANADIDAAAAIADTKLATIATAGKVANSATTATSAGTANAIVARDASGNFTAGTITATLNGTANNVSGTVAISNGGTGATTSSGAFDALSPLTTIGDILYAGTGGTDTRLAGNTSATKMFLSSTGTGSAAQAPAWGALAAADIPALDAGKITTGTLSNSLVNWAAPGTIGSSTPNTGAFTTLTATGNVGIGTTSPDTKLSIV